MAHEPDPAMWETHVWRTLATELFAQLAEEKKLRAFAVDLNPGHRRPSVIVTTTPRTATLEFEEQAPTGPRGDHCVECGSTRVSYENYLGQLFCWPCANGDAWPRHPRKGSGGEGCGASVPDEVNLSPDTCALAQGHPLPHRGANGTIWPLKPYEPTE